MDQALMFRALGSPLRLRLFRLTLARPYCVQALARITGLTESAISQQMRILRQAGLVTAEKHGYHTHFAADRRSAAVVSSFAEEMTATVFDPVACGCRKQDPECHCGEGIT